MEPRPLHLLPPKPDKCQVCAVKHEEYMPHDRDSLYYQIFFKREFGRDPTWDDAMAHCTPEMRSMWIEELTKLGQYP